MDGTFCEIQIYIDVILSIHWQHTQWYKMVIFYIFDVKDLSQQHNKTFSEG